MLVCVQASAYRRCRVSFCMAPQRPGSEIGRGLRFSHCPSAGLQKAHMPCDHQSCNDFHNQGLRRSPFFKGIVPHVKILSLEGFSVTASHSSDLDAPPSTASPQSGGAEATQSCQAPLEVLVIQSPEDRQSSNLATVLRVLSVHRVEQLHWYHGISFDHPDSKHIKSLYLSRPIVLQVLKLQDDGCDDDSARMVALPKNLSCTLQPGILRFLIVICNTCEVVRAVGGLITAAGSSLESVGVFLWPHSNISKDPLVGKCLSVVYIGNDVEGWSITESWQAIDLSPCVLLNKVELHMHIRSTHPPQPLSIPVVGTSTKAGGTLMVVHLQIWDLPHPKTLENQHVLRLQAIDRLLS